MPRGDWSAPHRSGSLCSTEANSRRQILDPRHFGFNSADFAGHALALEFL